MQAPQTPRPALRASDGRSADVRAGRRPGAGTPERSPLNHTVVSADAGAAVSAAAGLGPEPELALGFRSILLPPGAADREEETAAEPEFFADLNLDKIVAAITLGKDDYDLNRFFYRPTRDCKTVEYRHEVMRDLEREDIIQMIRSFARSMRATREHRAQSDKLHYAHQKKLWFLDAIDIYCAAVAALAQDLRAAALQSRGLLGFRRYLIEHTNSERFTALVAETDQLKADLSTIRYSMVIKDSTITVRKYAATDDYSAEVLRTFDKFKQGAVKNHRAKFQRFGRT